MTSTADLFVDGFGRVHERVHTTLDGLSVDDLVYRPADRANPIGWLIWHLTRVQDHHVAGAAGTEQRWSAESWSDRFALPFDRTATGYGQDPGDTGSVRVDAGLLGDYHDAVHKETVAFVRTLGDDDLDLVVDRRWDPPVTLGVRLMSVLEDDLQHVGQAAYLRGLLGR